MADDVSIISVRVPIKKIDDENYVCELCGQRLNRSWSDSADKLMPLAHNLFTCLKKILKKEK